MIKTCQRAFCRHGTCISALLGLLLALASGCQYLPEKEEEPALLGPRGVVPMPYSEPRPAEEPSASHYAPESPQELPFPEPVESMETPVRETGEMVEAEPQEPQQEFEMPPAIETKTQTYTVEKGDSLWEIARMYGVSQQELAAHNNMDVDDTLIVGKVLRIPPGGQFVPVHRRDETQVRGPREQQPREIPADRKYTVKKNDSLWKIAQRFDVRLDALKELNDLSSDTIHPGQVLMLPAGASERPRRRETPTASEETETQPEVTFQGTAQEDERDTGAEDQPDVTQETTEPATDTGEGQTEETQPPLPNLLDHTVTEGDTLKGIADMYGTTVEQIKKANPNIKSDTDLIPGLKLLIPFE